MCQSNEQMQRERQAEPIHIQTEAVALQQEQQTAPQQEQQMAPQQAELQQNEVLQERTRQQLPAAQAQQAAPGGPVQEEAPARRSWKQRQKDKRHARIARRESPAGTAVTYDIVTALQDVGVKRDQTMKDHHDLVNGVDPRVLSVFSAGYKVNRRGEPATEEDAAAKAADDQFFADYCSKDVVRRRPHLHRIVDEILAFRFTPNMLSEDNLRTNMAGIKSMADKLTYIENIVKDPVNKPFFDALPPAQRELLDRQTLAAAAFGSAAMTRCAKYGADYNGLKYYKQKAPIEDAKENEDLVMQVFRQNAMDYQQEADRRMAEETHRSATDYAVRMQQGSEALERIKGANGLNLTPQQATSQYVTRSVTLLKTGEGHDEENKDMLRSVMQAGDLIKSNQKPPAQLYEKVRDIAAGPVRKVLECDVDALAAMSDTALMLHAPLLNELSMNSMFVDDLMKLYHPTQTWRNDKKMTLKDELVGQDSRVYSYKVSMLRGLAERARAMAIRQQLQSGAPDVQETCLTRAERSKLGNKTLEQFAEEREQTGLNQIESAREKFRVAMDVRSPEFAKWLTNVVSDGATQITVRSLKFDQVRKQLSDRSIPEVDAALKRVRDTRFCNLAYTKAQAAELGLHTDISEPIFRSFDSFLSLEATEKLLTPEQFYDMVVQLGEGSEITDDSPQEDRDAAVQENKKGLATYKEVLRAHYDMLERKYGDALEHLTFEEAAAHYQDLGRDFCDSQVQLNMCLKFPDFFDPESPEDELLKERIYYYAQFGNAALSTLPILMTNQRMEKVDYSPVLRDPECMEGRQYLGQNRSDFTGRTIDWSQKVHVPGED